jgi:urate oxidase
VADITITMPNKHHLLVDLKPFDLENPNEIFLPTEAPFGLIEATLRRV